MREETRCRHMDYSFQLTARVLLYAPFHRQESTFHSLCYTSRGALAGKTAAGCLHHLSVMVSHYGTSIFMQLCNDNHLLSKIYLQQQCDGDFKQGECCQITKKEKKCDPLQKKIASNYFLTFKKNTTEYQTCIKMKCTFDLSQFCASLKCCCKSALQIATMNFGYNNALNTFLFWRQK